MREGLDEDGKYAGGKWGGLYLRAPDIFFRVLEKAGDKLVRLGEVAEVRFGIKTGANDFFYLEVLPYRPTCPLCGRAHEKALTREEEIPYQEGVGSYSPDTLVAVRSEGGWEGYIEARNLRPIVKSYRAFAQNPEAIPSLRVFAFTGGEHAEAYLRYGEEKGVSQRPSVSGRTPWWKLSPLTPPLAVVPAGVDRNYLFVHNRKGFLIDKRLYGLYEAPPVVVNLMNTTIFRLSLEVLVRTGLGGGLADFTVYEYGMGLLLDPALLPEEAALKDKKIDDSVVARVLGLTPEEEWELSQVLQRMISERVFRAKTGRRNE
nr:hypothetical protein [Thermus thalpophilus]